MTKPNDPLAFAYDWMAMMNEAAIAASRQLMEINLSLLGGERTDVAETRPATQRPAAAAVAATRAPRKKKSVRRAASPASKAAAKPAPEKARAAAKRPRKKTAKRRARR